MNNMAMTSKVAGPGRAISIKKNDARVVVYMDGRVIADTGSALMLHEGWLPPVVYVPREDVDMSLFTQDVCGPSLTDMGSRTCYSVGRSGVAANVAWTYDETSEEAAAIREHIAFDLKYIDAIEEHPG
jgi:uncharacterized protein (DUF427 family)